MSHFFVFAKKRSLNDGSMEKIKQLSFGYKMAVRVVVDYLEFLVMCDFSLLDYVLCITINLTLVLL